MRLQMSLFAYIVAILEIPKVVCAMNEDHVTLNYEDILRGTSELVFSALIGGSSIPDIEARRALLGSGTYLPLPSNVSDEKTIQLVISRSPKSSSRQFRMASMSLGVVNTPKVDIQLFDSDRALVAQQTVT